MKRQTLLTLCQAINEELNPDYEYYEENPVKQVELQEELIKIKLTDSQYDTVQAALTAIETILGNND